jgi:hypothetical protein
VQRARKILFSIVSNVKDGDSKNLPSTNPFGFINIEPLFDKLKYKEPRVVLRNVGLRLFNLNVVNPGWAAVLVSWISGSHFILENIMFEKSNMAYFLHSNEFQLPPKMYPEKLYTSLNKWLQSQDLQRELNSSYTIKYL